MTATAERNHTTDPEAGYFFNGASAADRIAVSPAHANALAEAEDAWRTAANMQALADEYAGLAGRWRETAAALEVRADEVAVRTGGDTLGRGAIAFAEATPVE